MSDARTEWEKQLPTEIAYWNAVIGGTYNNKERVDAFQKRVRGDYDFPAHLRRLLPQEPAGTYRILDVGAGPHTVIGLNGAPQALEIAAVDPLAEEYAKLMANHGVTPSVPTTKGTAEGVAQMFPANAFDIVYSRNALDHSFDPLTALRGMAHVCRPGGTVYLEGTVNEGVSQNYQGLHFWNFMPVDNDLVIWNRAAAHSVSRMLGDQVKVNAKSHEGRWYQVTMRKMSA